MKRIAALTAIGVSTVLAAHLWAQAPSTTFQGYWIGIDPVDGGDQRRSLVQQDDGLYTVVGRDTTLTLCGGTDFGISTLQDGTLSNRNRTIESDSMTLRCFNNNTTLALRARYELVNDFMLLETITRQDGTPVHSMVMHKISR
jgi:hypothetical protein